jgi:ribosomal protein L32E
VGGLVGGGFVTLLGYAYYHYSGASTVVNITYSEKKKFEDALKKSAEKTPQPNEAIQWLRETATGYAGFSPGGKSFVNTAFDDPEAIQRKHPKEVDEIITNAYNELKDVSKQSAKFATIAKSWDAI